MTSTAPQPSAPDTTAPPELQRLLRLPDVCAQTGASRAQIYRLIAAGEFPGPVKLYGKASAWPESEVQAWIADKIKASRGGAVHAPQ